MLLSIRIRLSILFFFQFFIWGAWGVSVGNLSEVLGFTSPQIGLIFSTTAIAAMISPFFVGMVADRFFPAQRILGVLHLLGGVFLLGLLQMKDFAPFWVLLFLHTICYMPTLALANTVAFSQMEDPATTFGGVRILGTIGWIAAGMTIGYLGFGSDFRQFIVAAGCSIALGIYSWLALPHVPPKARGETITVHDVLGLKALQLVRRPSFAVFAAAAFLISIPLAFYYSGAGRFLQQVGIADYPAQLTFGQISEAGFMLIFTLMLTRLGVKKMLILGMSCWVLRYVFFAFGDAGALYWMLFLGIILHGPCYDLFFVTGQVYVDQQATPQIRAAAQGLFAFITYGVGMFLGFLIHGFILQRFTVDGRIHWPPTWLIPAAGSVLVLIFFALFFRDPNSQGTAPKTT